MNVKDSVTSPLQIAEVAAGAGQVGLTLCPGKKGPSVSGYVWDRDLETDVAAIRAWGATAIVTLLEDHEFALLDVTRLPQVVHAAGLEWHHLPVTDVAAPDARFEQRWVYAGVRLRERLRGGERVLVHCRGGLGRTGSVAARMLVEFGASPRDAIDRVRAVRSHAIETREQEAWVLAQHPVDAAQDARASRELACLLGGAIGDALGYRVEFDSLATIRAKYGPEGIRLEQTDGRLVVSDDTQMTLFTLEGQLRARRNGTPLVESIREAYLDWYRTQRHEWHASASLQGLMAQPALWRPRAPGNTCLSALKLGGQGSIAAPINDSKGCGGVMRTATLGFPAPGIDDALCYVLGAEAAALTHGHPDGWAPAGVMALAVRKLLQGAAWRDVVDTGIAALAAHPQAHGTRDRLEDVFSSLTFASDVRESASFGRGWVGDEALAVGLHAAATAKNFAAAIETASNHDGDSDSTASIAGQLYGAMHGLGCLPAEAVYRVDVLDAVLELYAGWAGAAPR